MLMSPIARLTIAAIFLGGIGYAGYHFGTPYFHKSEPQMNAAYQSPEEQDLYVRFDMEAYDSIRKNFWKKTSEQDVAQLFQLSLEKVAATSSVIAPKDRAETAKMLAHYVAMLPDDAKKKEFAQNLIIVALYNLPPVGRNQILSQKQETALRQEVANVNPEKDLYADIGSQKGASQEEIKAAYETTKKTLEASSSPEAKEKLTAANYAYEVLTKSDTKERYDQAKIEPTIFAHRIGQTLYVYIERMSPTTFDEFVKAIKDDAQSPDASMIVDLRGNIGGALDIAPAMIGLFMGLNQFTFDLFHQDEYQPARSPIPKLGELDKYKDIAILSDGQTQSTAEVITAALKRLRLASVVGAQTRGWGTVENTFPLSTVIDPTENYALLLVHSLTLRDDNQPIEGAGVSPDINIADKDWRSQLTDRFRSQSLISALRTIVPKPPQKN